MWFAVFNKGGGYEIGWKNEVCAGNKGKVWAAVVWGICPATAAAAVTACCICKYYYAAAFAETWLKTVGLIKFNPGAEIVFLGPNSPKPVALEKSWNCLF